MTGIQVFHVALDVLVAVTCVLASWQWRAWQREAEQWQSVAHKEEAAAAAALFVARHFHERMQRMVADTEAMVSNTPTEEARELQ